MSGGLGNDWYVVDSLFDKVNEAAGQGNDRVVSTISYTLGLNVESLLLDFAGAINGTGNTLDNKIDGNLGVNKLDGGTGNDWLLGHEEEDTLIGGAGDDKLDGGAGDDTVSGGLGNDSYYGVERDDIIVELAGQGTDTVFADDTYSLFSFANVENLTLLGTDDLTGTATRWAMF